MSKRFFSDKNFATCEPNPPIDPSSIVIIDSWSVAICQIKFSSSGLANLASTMEIFTPFFFKFTEAFKKSVGLNGVGTKAVNALSDIFIVQSIRDGKVKSVDYSKGEITADHKIENTTLRNGTRVVFKPDDEIFKKYFESKLFTSGKKLKISRGVFVKLGLQEE